MKSEVEKTRDKIISKSQRELRLFARALAQMNKRHRRLILPLAQRMGERNKS